MNIELTEKEFRRLLDMVYIGNWVLNSTRGEDRFEDYDHIESKVFAQCAKIPGMHGLYEICSDGVIPSRAFSEGGIHEAICQYEDSIFYELLAEELALKDMDNVPIDSENYDEFAERINEYILEFEQNGMDNIEFSK